MVFQEYEEAPVILKWLIEDFCTTSIAWGINPVCTRILEPIEGSSGVHEDYRAADFRQEYIGKRLYSAKQERDMLNFLNKRYPRNDGFKTAICHSFMGGPRHFHLQIPDLVKKLKEGEKKCQTLKILKN